MSRTTKLSRLPLLAGLVIALLAGPSAFAAVASVPKAKALVCAGKTKKKAIAAIEESWDWVLNGTIPERTLDERFSYIEGSEDPEFRAVLDDIAAKNAAMLVTTSTQVNKVTCSGKKTADVVYDLVLAGVPAPGLAGPGFAVLDGKTWKMSALTVCNLFSLADPLLLEEGPCAEIVLEG